MSIIEVNNVSKEFRLGTITNVAQSMRNLLARVRGDEIVRRKSFKALDGVDFSVEQGEVVGIIGTNGAGKSTLLKLLAGITRPSGGSVAVRGKVAPLIEVGAGLNPELTGRENIFLNGAILGIPYREIRKKVEEIIEFAEIKAFIDTPVKRYSSGMTIRLGFSIASSLDADILIVDEVLAVGDLAFQRKCFDRMENLIKRNGRTVLLVSHNIRQVERMCDRVILLENGKVIKEGEKSSVCELFYARSNKKIADQIKSQEVSSRPIERTGEVDVEEILLLNQDGKETLDVQMGEPLTIRLDVKAECDLEKPAVVIGFHTTDFFYISSMGTAHLDDRPDMSVGSNTVQCHIPKLPLMPGVYCLRVGIIDKLHRTMYYGEMLLTFSVHSKVQKVSRMPAWGVVEIPVDWDF